MKSHGKNEMGGHRPNKKGGEAAYIQAFPAWGRGDRVSGVRVLSLAAQMRLSFPCTTQLSFIPCLPYPAPTGHLPLEGKAAIRGCHLLKKAAKPPL